MKKKSIGINDMIKKRHQYSKYLWSKEVIVIILMYVNFTCNKDEL